MRRLHWWVAFVILGVLILWIANLWIAPLILSVQPQAVRANLGLVGDSFGVINSLFSGLGAFAVVVILAFDREARRVERRPYLSFEQMAASVHTAKMRPEQTFELALSAEVHNVSDAVAANVSVDAQVSSLPLVASSTFSNAPMRAGGKSGVAIVLSASGDDARVVMKKLYDDGFVRMELRAAGDSITGARWVTTVEIKFTLTATDQGHLRGVSEDRSDNFVIDGVVTKTGQRMILQAKDDEAVWSHGEQAGKSK